MPIVRQPLLISLSVSKRAVSSMEFQTREPRKDLELIFDSWMSFLIFAVGLHLEISCTREYSQVTCRQENYAKSLYNRVPTVHA